MFYFFIVIFTLTIFSTEVPAADKKQKSPAWVVELYHNLAHEKKDAISQFCTESKQVFDESEGASSFPLYVIMQHPALNISEKIVFINILRQRTISQ